MSTHTHTHTHTHAHTNTLPLPQILLSSEGLKLPWKDIWPLLLEHSRIVFQCGQPLDRVAGSLAPVLGEGEEKEALLKLLEAGCGVEDNSPPLSQTPFSDNTSSSTSSSEGM